MRYISIYGNPGSGNTGFACSWWAVEEEVGEVPEDTELQEEDQDPEDLKVDREDRKSSFSLTDFLVCLSPEELKILWSQRTWFPENRSITKSVSVLRSMVRRSSIESGILIAPRLLPQWLVVFRRLELLLAARFFTWEPLQALLYRTCRISLVPLVLFTVLNSHTESVEIL